MARTVHFFAGANSGDGFQNLFSQITDLEDTYDLMVLKGGPGVGKNTFMREVGRAMEAAGTPVEYLWCSGDPDSLDGVVLPALRCAVVDGTSPHVVEPRYPAAVDRYVDLGRFYDLTAAKIAAEAVKEHTHTYQAAYVRAYRNLKAARQVELDAFGAVRRTFDADRAQRRVEGILSRELRQKGGEQGRTVRRFLGSVTHQGYIWRFDSVDALCPKVYEFADSAELAGGLFEQIRRRGYHRLLCPGGAGSDRASADSRRGPGIRHLPTRHGLRRTTVPQGPAGRHDGPAGGKGPPSFPEPHGGVAAGGGDCSPPAGQGRPRRTGGCL